MNTPKNTFSNTKHSFIVYDTTITKRQIAFAKSVDTRIFLLNLFRTIGGDYKPTASTELRKINANNYETTN